MRFAAVSRAVEIGLRMKNKARDGRNEVNNHGLKRRGYICPSH
jgi:hypothetical protein